ncbi:MAG: hypothetical protein KKA67_07915 [Spirochaetes bacterium]|nr:hypothetical protein [Spirochaetota bacterium]MBU1079186.1 hypothetical protein [Spirochaetota bacterium]
MEAKISKRPLRRAWLAGGLSVAVALVAAGVYIGVTLRRGPDPAAVETSFRGYVESLAVAGKIVLVEAKERVFIRQTTPGFLFGDTAIGRLLGVRSDATIEASAWADVSFAIDLYSTEAWSARYDPADGGSLSVAAPPLAMLTPAIHTDTIEIRTVDRSIFLDEARLETSALRDLTARFVEAASRMIDDPALREKAAAAVEATVRMFAAGAGFPLERVDVSFAPAED